MVMTSSPENLEVTPTESPHSGPGPETGGVELLQWRDILPDREDIDSWATRFGASGLLTGLLSLKSQGGDYIVEGPSRGLAVAAITILCITMSMPLWRAMTKAQNTFPDRKGEIKRMVVSGSILISALGSVLTILPTSFGAVFNQLQTPRGILIFDVIMVAVVLLVFGSKKVSRYYRSDKEQL